MSAPIKDFSGIKFLRKELKAQDEARQKAEAERLRQEHQAGLDADLFRRSIGSVAPLVRADRHLKDLPLPLPVARHHEADERAALMESLSDDFSADALLDTDDALSYARAGIGADILKKLRRGHWVIQAQLDLHGMRRDEAREALVLFLRSATKRGLRCVRVIHGKGLGSPNKQPVLKDKVRSWLAQKEEVMAYCQARGSDGGAGALLVLLKAQV